MVELSNADSTAQRARWLAELAQALDEAHRLVKQVAAEQTRMDAIELSERIESAQYEVEALRYRRPIAGLQDFHPEWSKDIPWKLSA